MHAYITTEAAFCGSLLSSQPETTFSKESSATEKTVHSFTIDDKEKRIMAYPNPTNGLFSLLLTGYESKTDIRVFNMMGKVIYHTTSIGTDNLTITLPSVPGGIYTVRVSDAESVQTTKINLID